VKARKTVTALFADITGSTALSERLDPEALREVISRYFDEARMVIERHGGTVEKFIGDAVMAVFGVPVAHEDDALRAVRAGDDLRRALDRLNEELEGDLGLRLQARIGVNTGEVVVGDPSSGESFVTGDAVNVAARLEQSAEPGQILIGEETRRLIVDAVITELAGPLSLKGKSEPVTAHRLLEVRPGAAPHARRLDSPLVGRDAELAQLEKAFGEVVGTAACGRVTVVGEAGVGKSRLVAELVAELTGRAQVLFGRCLPYGEGITFWPIAEAIRAAAGITEEDSPEEAQARIASVVKGSEDAGLVADRVSAVLGLSESGGDIHEMFWAVRRVLESLARDTPLVFVAEDVHWAEPTLLDLIDYLVEFSADRSILILSTTRPELRDTRPEWVGGSAVILQPLSERDSEDLIGNLVGRAGFPADVRARIIDAAEGNPLFVEELLRMLIDDGLLVRQNGHWHPRGDLSTLALPSSIHALLSARLDRLSEEERAVIQRAAVVGKVFYWGAVAALAPQEMSDRVGAHLQALLRRELIRPERGGFVGEDAFRFSHILVREAAYESVPKRTRAELHERFAGWLEHKAGQRIAEHEEILGYHLEQAYRHRAALGPADPAARALARRAADRLAASGRRATQRGDVRAAVNLLGRAAELLGAEEPARPAVLTDLGVALVEMGQWERAEAVFTEATEAAAEAGDRRLEWLARIHLGHLRGHKDPQTDWTKLLEEAHRAIEVFQESEDDAGLARAWTLVSDVQNGLSQRAEMGEAAAKAVEHARRAGDRQQEANSVRLLVASLVFGPTPVREAISRCEAILRDADESPMLSVAILPPLAQLYGMEGRFEEARALFGRARAYQDELGLRHWSARMSGGAGEVEELAGNVVAAEREFRRGCELFKEMGETGRFSTVATQLADALYALERDHEALLWTEQSEEATAPDDLVSQVDWRRVRAMVLARRGETSRAEGLINEALRRAEASADDVHLHDKVYRSVAEVLRLAGRTAEAIPYAQRALELQERKGSIAGAARARALLEELTAEAG
jgi:class 3 adenylate cyclase/tetratricopeptide (TPR) repeat protein